MLRHRPDTVGLELDEAGWTDVRELLDAMNENGKPITREQLDYVVANNDKKRFIFNEGGTRIRANQGHSVTVELDHEECAPPDVLYHGTIDKFVPFIREQGLHKGERHDVHLSATVDPATTVGKRRGRAVILTIRSKAMHAANHKFYRTPNNIWLVDTVPPEFIDFPID